MMHTYSRRVVLIFAVMTCAQRSASAAGDSDRIRPFAENSYYWQYKGRPVLLLGGSVDDNLFQIPRLIEQLDLLQSVGGNYVRNTMSGRDEGNVWPFAKTDGRYDLDRWNEEYWRRFETFLKETARRDIIVQIEIWATFDYYRELWRDENAFNPRNNINYTAKESGLPPEVNSHPTRRGNPFFRSVPDAENLPLVRKYQERFVEKLLSHSLAYDHVLYAMDNETSVTPKWGAYWAAFVRTQATAAGKQVETTEMWDPWNLADSRHDATWSHPQLYTFLDISQNNHQKGQTHYDNALARRRSIADDPRPLTNTKIYGADGGRFGNSRDGVQRFWRNIFGGHAAARFHRPDSGLGLGDRAQRMIRSARDVTGALNVYSCRPANGLLDDRSKNEAFCLAQPGRQYAVYFPEVGEVSLDAKQLPGTASLRWYDIDRGRWLAASDVQPGERLLLKTPGDGQWAVLVRVR